MISAETVSSCGMRTALCDLDGRRMLTRVVPMVIGLLLLMSCLGWLVTGAFAHHWPFTAEDGVDRAFVAHRDRFWNDVTWFLSTIADTTCATILTIVAVAGARLYFRRWPEALFIAMTMAVEVSVFLLVTVLVHRTRPAVPELDISPPTSSFPSGHTAAALALYGSLALVIYLRTRRRWAWLLLLMPAAVGVARLYRGMHHPSDVIAGLLLGACSILIARYAVLVPEPGKRTRLARPGQVYARSLR
jgi:membrane-associated phospholipid phosphatase